MLCKSFYDTLAPLSDSWSRCARGIGSLWDPNITVETLEAHQLQLSFTPWNESTSYQVLLHSFPPAENQSCFQHVVDLPVVTALPAAFLTHQPGSEHPLHPQGPGARAGLRACDLPSRVCRVRLVCTWRVAGVRWVCSWCIVDVWL